MVQAQQLETQQPESLRVMYRESQHDLSLIRFPTSFKFSVEGFFSDLGLRDSGRRIIKISVGILTLNPNS